MKLAAVFTFLGFFMWIQPLGAFIAPSQETTACGGNRAYHMCSTQFTPSTTLSKTSSAGMSFTAQTGDERAPSAPGSAGGMDAASEAVMQADLRPQPFLFEKDPPAFRQPPIFLPDPVPKR
ncbi:MAG: hypothetical protein KBD07_02940 [Candidatus Omnitrophica bacterium]|jgi:hypothetical protein|nr:hypothetical protein [Candidatus Omnitrophota bacterium]